MKNSLLLKYMNSNYETENPKYGYFYASGYRNEDDGDI